MAAISTLAVRPMMIDLSFTNGTVETRIVLAQAGGTQALNEEKVKCTLIARFLFSTTQLTGWYAGALIHLRNGGDMRV